MQKDKFNYGNEGFSLLETYAHKISDTAYEIQDKRAKFIALYAIDVFKRWQKRRLNRFNNRKCSKDVFVSLYKDCALLLLKTMIYAFRVDDKIDRDEFKSLNNFYKQILGSLDVRGIIDGMLTQTLDPMHLKEMIAFHEEALDIYMLSAIILTHDDILDINYLENLAAVLNIDPTSQKKLNESALNLKKNAGLLN